MSPSSASRPVVSAMMPGRSWPRTVIACRLTDCDESASASLATNTSSSIVRGEPAGEGVVLAGVVAAEQGDPAQVDLGGVGEPRAWARYVVPRGGGTPRARRPSRSRRGRPRRARTTTAGRSRRAARGAGVALGDGGLVGGRGAADGRHHPGPDQPLAVAGVRGGRLGGEPDPVQAGEEPVARAVAGEDPAGAVAAVGRRRQADDQDARASGRPSRRWAGPSRAGRRTTPACPARRPRATAPAADTRGRPRSAPSARPGVLPFGTKRQSSGPPSCRLVAKRRTWAAVRATGVVGRGRVLRPAGPGRHRGVERAARCAGAAAGRGSAVSAAPHDEADHAGDRRRGERGDLGARLAGVGGRPVPQLGGLLLGPGLDVEALLQGRDGVGQLFALALDVGLDRVGRRAVDAGCLLMSGLP